MKKNSLHALFAAVLACLGSLAIAAPQSAETVAIGRVPSAVALDPVSGRAIVANAGGGRGSGGSIALLGQDRVVTTLAEDGGPLHVAVAARQRKAVVVQSWSDRVSVVDLDTMRASSVAAPRSPSRTVIDESRGLAYVIGKDVRFVQDNGAMRGIAESFVTVIDLSTGMAKTYPMPGFGAEDVALAPDGSRLFVVGSVYVRSGEWRPGFIQAFDTLALRPVGSPVPLGRVPQHVLVSPAGDKVYVVAHADHPRATSPGIRPALFVLESRSLALERTFMLPDTKNIALLGQQMSGQSEVDPYTGLLYVMDRNNRRLTRVDPVSGAQVVADFEASPASFALNPVAGTVVASLGRAGQAAILGPALERLDTVPIGRALAESEAPAGHYGVAVDARTGDTYIANGHDGTLAILRGTAEAAKLVNVTDLWHTPAEPGWGVFLDQQGTALFAALFTYDATGAPSWLVMSNGARQPDGSFAGTLYRTQGPSFKALSNVTAAGVMRFRLEASGKALLTYVLDGVSTLRTVERFSFDHAPRRCEWAVGEPRPGPVERANFTALWSNPADPGWGVALSQQGSTLFGMLFTYDEQNRPSWAVMSNGRVKSPGVYGGELFRPSRGRIEAVGTMTLEFGSTESGTLSYRMDGGEFRAPLIRQTFAPITSRCTS
ncbi:MAG TPA: hypothetical protein VFK48_18660 [Usitatibacter sp.]|nr:hypothetical protein [Usitatibacter sp.]